MLAANLTVFTKRDADGVMTKVIQDDGHGGIVKDSSHCKMARGEMAVTNVSFEALAQALPGWKQHRALALCNVAREGAEIVARGIEQEGGLQRTLETFAWGPGPSYLLLDVDPRLDMPPDDPETLIRYLEKAWPGISAAKRIESYGTSACIRDELGQTRTGLGSYHLYVAVEDMGAVLASLPGERQSEQLRALRERIMVRCWNAGLGSIFVDRAGRMHPRALIDLSVFSPERLIFEAAPVLPEGWTQERPAPKVVDGGWLPVEIMTNPLTARERLQFQQALAETRSQYRDKAEVAAAKYRDREVKKLTEAGMQPADAQRLIESRQGGIVDAGELLYFQGESEPVQASRVLLSPSEYAGRYLADPVEPDYGGALGSIVTSKACLQVNKLTGEVNIHSFAHGGIDYRVQFDRKAYLALIERLHKEGGDALEHWKRLLVRHTQKMSADHFSSAVNRICHLLKIGTKEAKAALEEESAEFERARDEWRRRYQPAFSESQVRPETEEEIAEREASELSIRRQALWEQCRDIASRPNILDYLVEVQARRGVVGEALVCKAVYLAVTSRLLEKPVNVLVKGDSSAGKSFNTEETLKFFPDSVVVNASGLSEKAIYYLGSLKHRVLYLAEATPLQSDEHSVLAYAVRTLLSEGRLSYWRAPTTEDDSMEAILVEVEGPTGFLCTTTAVALHPENETRMLSISVDDSEEQTRRVLQAIAGREERPDFDFAPWHALQEWLPLTDLRVAVPYKEWLAREASADRTRMRRDFMSLLNLIKASAILHQANRGCDDSGRIIADADDYANALGVVMQGLQQSHGRMVGPGALQVIEYVRDEAARRYREDAFKVVAGLVPETEEVTHEDLQERVVEVTTAALGARFRKSKSTVSRWVKEAIEAGYLVNEQKYRGAAYSMQLRLDEPLGSGGESDQSFPSADSLLLWLELGI